MHVILYFCLLILAIYTIIPDLFLHRLGIGARKRQYTTGVAITFDDGPNPEITPQILEILDKYRIKTTFFLVGKKAAQYPDLVKDIYNRGHNIGVHSYNHKYAWFMNPYKTWREWDKSIATIESITGERVEWIRPPWGTFNLALWIWLIVRKKKAVLWDVEGHDWQVNNSPNGIIRRVIKKVKEGTIVVLHDDGVKIEAPINTLKALDTICKKILEEKKLPIENLDFPSWSFGRRFSYRLWEKWELLFSMLFKIKRISHKSIIRISISHYKGPTLFSDNGEILAKSGDLVGELHIDSGRLSRNEIDAHKLVFKTLHMVKESLPVLAQFVESNPNYSEIKVFLGLSLMNRGVRRLGFQVQEVPRTFSNRWVGLLQRIIIKVYHPLGKLRSGKITGNPKLVWISRETLLKMWLSTL